MIAFLVTAAPVYAQDHALLRRLAQGEAGAEDEWHDLSAAKQVALLREGLQAEDPRIRYLAARAVDPHCLSLEEVRRQATVLASHAEWLRDPKAATPAWAGGITPPFGAPELPRLWQTVASAADLPGAREQLLYWHRALLPEHIPVLVEQLERAGPEVFLALADTLRLVADYTSEHRDVAARGLLYALERLCRERNGQARPGREDVTLDPASKDAFVALAKAAWGLDRRRFTAKDPHLDPPHAWLVRWGREIDWEKEDVPFLRRVVWRADAAISREWAIRRLGKLEDRETLLELAEGKDRLAVSGAAELARLGEPTRFLELLAEQDWGLDGMLAWYAAPAQARRRRLGEMLVGPGVSDLDPLGRYELGAEHEVRIRDQDLAWIGENLLKIDVQPARLAAFFGLVHPRGLTSEVAARIAERLRGETWAGDLDEAQIAALLAPLEVAHRDALVGLLDHWAGRGQSWALLHLARLGEARHVPAMLAAWAEWYPDAWVLGRVRDARVEKFLRKHAEAGVAAAVQALAIHYGLPEPVRLLLEDPDDEERRLVLERDPVGAAIHAAKPAGGWHLARLGLVRDERVIACLRELRAQRHRGEYWAATAGLALAGDVQAQAEFGALMREGRTWLLDSLADHYVLTLGGRPEWIDFWLSRVNTNCCVSYIAIECVLSEIYPAIPLEHDGIVDYACKERFARAWLDTHAFRRSRILDGLVPVAKHG